MKKQILESLDRLHYFSIESFMQIADLTENEKAKARNLLSRAVKANQIIRLKNGLYITRNFYERFHQDARFQPVISQIINPYSYVSSLYILQKENIIPEAVYSVTAVTQKNTSTFSNLTGTYTYQSLKGNLYLGYSFQEFADHPYYLATKAKALFDYLYLKPIPRSYRKKSVFLSADLRLDLDNFNEEDKEEFRSYVQISESEKMNMVYENMEIYSWQH